MLESLHIESLIEERMAYEEDYFKVDDVFIVDIEKSREMDFQIEQYNEPEYYEPVEDFYYEDIFFCEDDYMQSSYGCSGLMDYVPNDDLFDTLDCYDYPEGPEENLSGYNPYPEQYYDPIEEMYSLNAEDSIADLYVENVNSHESYIDKLIENHLAEEREFMQYAIEYSRNDELEFDVVIL